MKKNEEIKYISTELKIYISLGFMGLLLDLLLAIIYIYNPEYIVIGLLCFIAKLSTYMVIIKTNNKWIYRLAALLYIIAEIPIINNTISWLNYFIR